MIDRCIVLTTNENITRYIFPTFFVSTQNAAIITTRIIAELAAADTKDTTYRWNNHVINPKTYMAKNLSIPFPYSIPTSQCQHCVNLSKKLKAECLACGGSPIMEPNNIFVPQYDICFTTGNIRKYEETLSLSDFIACCVSHPYSSTTYQAPIVNVNYPVGTPHCPAVNKKQKIAGGLWGKEFDPVEPGIARLIQRLVRTQYADTHSKSVVDVNSVKFDVKKQEYFFYIKGCGSCYCVIKSKDHKDSFIAGSLTVDGILLFCKSNEVVNGQPCKTISKNRPRKKVPFNQIQNLFKSKINTPCMSGGSSLPSSIRNIDINLANINALANTTTRKFNVFWHRIDN